MNIRESLYQYFDQEIMDTYEVAKLSGCSKATIVKYRNQWCREHGKPLYHTPTLAYAKQSNPNVSKKCKSCRYRTSYGCKEMSFCDYISIEHKRRGCPAGDECTRYSPRRKEKEA